MRIGSPRSLLKRMIRTPQFGVLLLSLGFVFALLCYVNTDYIWLTGMGGTMNDQAAYISTARALVDTGELRSSIVYPSLLTQEATVNYPYMPGQYLVLAASYLAWGYSPFASFLPSLIAYSLSACALFTIAFRLHDRTTAYLSSFIFLSFPVVLSYSCSAMAESTFVAAGLLAFALFLFVPPRQRPFAGPLLLLLPVLFRETGALFVIPMVAVIVNDGSRTWKKDSLVLVGLSVTLVSLLVFGFFGDRPTFMEMNLAGANISQKYLNAFNDSAISLSLSEWPRAVLKNFSDNWDSLSRPPTYIPRFEVASLWFILLATPLGFVLGAMTKDRLLLGYSLMSVAVCTLLLTTYSVWAYVAVRNTLFCLPFAAIIYSKAMASLCPDRHHRKLLLSTLACGIFIASAGVHHLFAEQDAYYRNEANVTVFLEQLDHDDSRLLVSAIWSLPFVITHYPVQLSFIPANVETLRLLMDEYEVGSMLLSFDSKMSELSREEVEREGFVQVRQLKAGGKAQYLFRPKR